METTKNQNNTLDEVKDSMRKQYREERVITKGTKVCQFINAKFKVTDIMTGTATKFDTLEEAVDFMV